MWYVKACECFKGMWKLSCKNCDDNWHKKRTKDQLPSKNVILKFSANFLENYYPLNGRQAIKRDNCKIYLNKENYSLSLIIYWALSYE